MVNQEWGVGVVGVVGEEWGGGCGDEPGGVGGEPEVVVVGEG